MTYEESEGMFFRLSKLEGLVKLFVSKGDLEKSMNNLREYLEKRREGTMKTMKLINLEERIEEKVVHMKGDIVESIVKLLQNLEDQLPKVEDVGQATSEDNDYVSMGQPCINRNDLRGFDSNTGSK